MLQETDNQLYAQFTNALCLCKYGYWLSTSVTVFQTKTTVMFYMEKPKVIQYLNSVKFGQRRENFYLLMLLKTSV